MGLWIADANVSTPVWIIPAGISLLHGNLYFCNFAIAISTSRWLSPGTSGSAVCIAVCLTYWHYAYLIIECNNSTYLKCLRILKQIAILNVFIYSSLHISNILVRFEVFTSVTMENGVFWVVTPCGSCKNRRFGGTWRPTYAAYVGC
jgi:hypothetical protein